MLAYRGLPQIALLLLFLSGCGKGAVPQAKVPTPINVVATVYPLADIARQVGGPNVACDWIAEQTQRLDLTDPTDQTLAKIRGAELILTGGAGEDWAVDGFDDPNRARLIVRLDLLDSGKSDVGCRQLWLDPAVAKEFANVVADRLAIQRPQQAQVLHASAARFGGDVDHLMGGFAIGLNVIRGQKVLVLSTDFSALSRASDWWRFDPSRLPQ